MKLVSPVNLACPLCGEPLTQNDRTLLCYNRHSFDLARLGYVNLLPVQHKNSRNPGDSKAMVDARRDFLDHGFYRPVAEALVRQVLAQAGAKISPEPFSIVDAGCGEGYYLDVLAQALGSDATVAENRSFSATGLDISKEAIAAAARRNRALQWIVGTNVHPPFTSASVDCLLCLFGFPSLPNFRNMLRPGGIILMADPGPDHLIELRETIYPEVRRSGPAELGAIADLGLTLRSAETLQFRTAALNQAQIHNLLAMTPHLFRASHEGKQAAAQLRTLQLTVEVVFRVLELPADEPKPV